MQTKKRFFLYSICLSLFCLSCMGILWSSQKIQQLTTAQQTAAYQAESQYQRSFWELSSSITSINGQLAQLLVTSSQEQLLLGLSNLWREVYRAVNHLGGLPVAMHELESTDLLLSDVAEYSYYLLRQNVLKQKPLSQGDWTQLEEFYRRSRIVQEELQHLEKQILSENLLLSTLSLEDEENAVATTFRSIETQVDAFPALKFEEGVRKMEPEPHPLSGESVTETQAIQRADLFLDQLEIAHTKGILEFTSQGNTIPIYGIRYQLPTADTTLFVEVSQIGGQVLQFYQTRTDSVTRYSVEQAITQAQSILQALGFSTMVCIEQNLDSQLADLTFVPLQENVYLYPDMINLQISLEDLSLCSYDQTSYATHHYQRALSAPRLSPAQLLQGMNPNFSVNATRLALIPEEYRSNELLTYEIQGTILGESFSIFIDAQTGQEVRIVRH